MRTNQFLEAGAGRTIVWLRSGPVEMQPTSTPSGFPETPGSPWPFVAVVVRGDAERSGSPAGQVFVYRLELFDYRTVGGISATSSAPTRTRADRNALQLVSTSSLVITRLSNPLMAV